ncbi:MAG: fluoride efflux transporter CrcB [bacterium]|nr:fluoride efflux transporter CrcB [bacterium]
MTNLLIIGLGGFIGAIARYGISGLVQSRTESLFPYGTLAVNLLGCLMLGCLLYFIEDRAMISMNTRLFLTVGVMGALTTFSTFGYETVQLFQYREFEMAMLNIAGNIILGVGGFWLGRMIMRAINL